MSLISKFTDLLRDPVGLMGCLASTMGNHNGVPNKWRRSRSRLRSFSRIEHLEQRHLLAVEVIFDYRYDTRGFFSNPAYRQSLEAAGAVIGESLNDRLSEINPQKASFLDGVARSWTVEFPIPNDEVVKIERSSNCVSRTFLGICTQEQYVSRRTIEPIPQFTPALLTNLVVPLNSIVVFVGSGNALRNKSNGVVLASSFTPSINSVSGPVDWQDTVRFRGQLGAKSASPTDFATWGGSLIFNRDPADVVWHADPSTNPSANAFDLFSTALHELGHVFGFTDSNPSWKNQLSSGNTFTGRASAQMYGGPVPVDAGSRSHWENFVISPQDNIPVAMGPSTDGRRTPFSALDFAGLNDIGWEVNRTAAGILSETVRGFVRDSNGSGIGGAWIQAACVETTSPRGCPFFLVPPILGTTRPDGSFTVSTSTLERGVWSLFSVLNGQVLDTKNVNFSNRGQISEVNFTAPASLSLVSSTATSNSRGYLLSGSDGLSDIISIRATGSRASATINGVAFSTESRDISVERGGLSDQILLDFSNGNPTGPNGSITVKAGQDVLGAGSDRLVVGGGAFSVFSYEVAGYNAGRLLEANVTFDEIEQLDLNSDAEVISISFSDDIPHSVEISDDDDPGNGKSRLLIDGLHEMTFRNPSKTLRINTSIPGSSVTFSGADLGFAAGIEVAAPELAIDADGKQIHLTNDVLSIFDGPSFTILNPETEIETLNATLVSAHGSSSDDLIAVDISGQDTKIEYGNYVTRIPSIGFRIEDMGNDDLLQLLNIGSNAPASRVEFLMETNSSGLLSIDDEAGNETFSINFVNVARLQDDFRSTDRVYNFPGTANTIAMNSNDDYLSISNDGFSSKFFAPSVGLILNTGEDSDQINIDALGFSGIGTRLLISSGDGDDEVYLDRTSAEQTHVTAGAGNDFVRVGETNLASILGSVVINGGEHDRARTETQIISVSGEVREREKTVGDRIEVFGDENETNAVVSVMGESINVSSHAGSVEFTQIETITIQNAIAGNRVSVIETNEDQNVVVFGGEIADRVTIANTGKNSFVDVLVGGGDDIINVENTGMGSWLSIWTYDGIDEVTVNQSGGDSVVNIETGTGNDRPWIQDTGENSLLRIATDDGDDALILNGTGVGSRTEYFAGAGNERVLVSSVTEHTTYIKGDVWLHGGDDGPDGSSDRTGDGLEFYYNTESDQQNLSLSANTFQRTDSNVTGVVNFEGWESVFVYASEVKDHLRVSGTAIGSFVDARLLGGDDELIVESTGDASVLSVATGGGKDAADIFSTGVDSQFQIYTEVAPDEYDLPFGDESVLIRSSGENSRVGVVTGRGEDTVTVLATGVGSEMQIATGQSSDVISLRGSGIRSTTLVGAGEANDRIIITSDSNSEYAIGGSFFVYGDENDETSTSESSINAQGKVISRLYSEGDTLDLLFSGADDPKEYQLDASKFSRIDDQSTERGSVPSTIRGNWRLAPSTNCDEHQPPKSIRMSATAQRQPFQADVQQNS